MTFADGWFLAFFFMMVAGPTAMILEALWSKIANRKPESEGGGK